MARNRSIASIDSEMQKIEEELIKVHNKQEALEAELSKLQADHGCLQEKWQEHA